MLLRAQAVLMNGKGPAKGEEFRKVLASPDARQAIQSLIRRAKAHTVGRGGRRYHGLRVGRTILGTSGRKVGSDADGESGSDCGLQGAVRQL